MAELAIFGSMVIMVLGALISYGLSADYRQQAIMEASRRAMLGAALARADGAPQSITHSVMMERLIPDPTDSFAVGTVTTASSVATNPTRSFTMSKSAGLDRVEELSHQILTIKTPGDPATPVRDVGCSTDPSRGPGCTTQGYWEVPSFVSGFDKDDDGALVNGEWDSPLDLYNLVFGTGNVRPRRPSSGGVVLCVKTNADGDCIDWSMRVQITDPVLGDIPNRSRASVTCRQLVSSCFDAVAGRSCCVLACLHTKPSPFNNPKPAHLTDCESLCSQTVDRPPYCDASRPPSYTTQAFDQMFATFRNLGIQPGSSSDQITNTELERHETTTRVETTDWTNALGAGTTRTFVYQRPDAGCVAGDVPTPDNALCVKTLKTVPRREPVNNNVKKTWSTPWP